MIILRAVRWTGHVTCVGENESGYKVFRENLKERYRLEAVGGRIILKWIVK
jgi:hypothetical protein